MKARDLRGKNIEDMENEASEPKEEEDAVSAAYENISKRLESIRNGKDNDEETAAEGQSSKVAEVEEPELTEWKGPKPPSKESDESDEPEDSEEHELKKVNLHNLEDAEKDEDKEEEADEEEVAEGQSGKGSKRDEEEKAVEKEWEPSEDDPLDDEEEVAEEEDEDREAKMQRGKDAENDEENEVEAVHSEMKADKHEDSEDEVSEKSVDDPKGPDTLDDLAEDSPFGQNPENKTVRDEDESYRQKGSAYDRDSEEDDYSIPNLKGSGQRGSEMSYNSREAGVSGSVSQRESVGQSYSPKGSYMEGNDPNNFFNQHQTPKRANKFHLLVLVIIGIAVIGFTVYVLKGGFGGLNLGTGTQASPSPSATVTPDPTPTPTPEPEVERGNFTVRVLNGTSTSGLARTVSDKLEETGYKIANPGNAEDNDVEQTEIRVKEGTESAALFERLKLDLAPDYEAIEGEKLDEDSKNDAEVIIGSR